MITYGIRDRVGEQRLLVKNVEQGGTINCRVVISLTILEGKLNLVKIYEI